MIKKRDFAFHSYRPGRFTVSLLGVTASSPRLSYPDPFRLKPSFPHPAVPRADVYKIVSSLSAISRTSLLQLRRVVPRYLPASSAGQQEREPHHHTTHHLHRLTVPPPAGVAAPVRPPRNLRTCKEQTQCQASVQSSGTPMVLRCKEIGRLANQAIERVLRRACRFLDSRTGPSGGNWLISSRLRYRKPDLQL